VRGWGLSAMLRGVILGLGAALLVGGWGATRYAHEQVAAWDPGPGRWNTWRPLTRKEHIMNLVTEDPLDREWRFGRGAAYIYAGGVVAMAVGAGLVAPVIRNPKGRRQP
jgi:hypothetical protein